MRQLLYFILYSFNSEKIKKNKILTNSKQKDNIFINKILSKNEDNYLNINYIKNNK